MRKPSLGWGPLGGLIGLALLCTAESFCLVGLTYVRAQQAGGYLPPLAMDAKYEDKRVVQDLRAAYRRVLTEAPALDDHVRQVVRDYFENYLIKSLTRPENFSSWQVERARWSSDLVRLQARSVPVHDYVVDFLFGQMRPLVEQNHHPLIRVNAMLAIGELNRRERGSGAAIAQPLETTLAYIREQVRNPDQIDAVRIAGLAGILRHVESFWLLETTPADDLISGLTSEMLDLLANKPADRPSDVHAWIQARALDILGSLSGWRPVPEALRAMQTVLVDANAPVWLRLRAAYALSRVKYDGMPDVDKIDWPTTAAGLAGLLADACRSEHDWLEREREKLKTATSSVPGVPGVPGEPGLAGGAGVGAPPPPGEPDLAGGGAIGLPPPPGEMDAEGGIGFPASGMGMMPYGPFGPTSMLGGLPKYKVEAVRRRLLYELACVRAALQGPSPDATVKGIKPIAGNHPTAGPVLNSIEKALSDVEKVANAKELDMAAMLKTLRTRSQELEQFRPQVQPMGSGVESDVPSDIPPPAGTPGG